MEAVRLARHVTPLDLSIRLKALGAGQDTFAFWILNPRMVADLAPGEALALLSWHGDVSSPFITNDERVAAYLCSELGEMIVELLGPPGDVMPDYNPNTRRWEQPGVSDDVYAYSEVAARGLWLEWLLGGGKEWRKSN